MRSPLFFSQPACLDHETAAGHPSGPPASSPSSERSKSADGSATSRGRRRRAARRSLWAQRSPHTPVLAIAYLVALAVPLVWLVVFAAILGWLIGILVTVLFRWRTSAAHPSGRQR
jgi:hypothetical protein